MGWLWSTADAPARDESKNVSTPAKPSADAHTATTVAPTRQLSRDELAEQELQAFLRDLEAPPQPSSTKYTRLPQSAPSTSSSTSKPSAPISTETLSEQLLPKTMSCRDAFDSAFYCNSLGGQFNNLYRYGTVRACSENWNDFWFCMKTRSYGSREKEEAIRERYRDKQSRKYGPDADGQGEGKVMAGRSSEDVWKSREKKVEWGEPFIMPFPEIGGGDEEWNRRERLRRAGQVDGSMGS